MTVNLPTRTVKPYRKRGYIPEPRPEGGYRITSDEQPTWTVEGDHGQTIRQMLADLESLDAAMLVIERKAETLIRKLSDPALFDQWPADHPTRIEAEDRLSDQLQSLNVHRLEVSRIASEIHTRGAFLFAAGNESALDRFGEKLTRDCGALGRVQMDVDGLLTGYTWQRLYAAACPF